MPDFFSESTTQEDSRIISNVLLCGAESKNGYRIPTEAFVDNAHVVSLYSEVPVFLDHAERGKERNRSIKDAAGVIRNPRLEGGVPRGDIECYQTENGQQLFALAKAKPKRVGLSHTAAYDFADSRRKQVKKVTYVESVDVVINPATTVNFHEDTNMADDTAITLLQEQVESLRSESSEAKAEIARLKQEQTTLTEAVSAKDAEITKLSEENAKLKTDLDVHVTRLALEQRRKDVLAALEEAGLDTKNTTICSEQFILDCTATSDAESLKAKIEDRKSLLNLSTEGTLGSRERKKGSQESSVDALLASVLA